MMNFGKAIEALREGKKVAREGYAADDSIVCGWLASQTDMLSEDWTVIE